MAPLKVEVVRICDDPITNHSFFLMKYFQDPPTTTMLMYSIIDGKGCAGGLLSDKSFHHLADD